MRSYGQSSVFEPDACLTSTVALPFCIFTVSGNSCAPHSGNHKVLPSSRSWGILTNVPRYSIALICNLLIAES